jgi:hypothetical protein
MIKSGAQPKRQTPSVSANRETMTAQLQTSRVANGNNHNNPTIGRVTRMTTDKGTDKPSCGVTRNKGSGCGNAGESTNKQTKTPSMNDCTIRELVEMVLKDKLAEMVLKDELGDMIAEVKKKMEARTKDAILVEFKKQKAEMINFELQKRLLQGT